MATTAAPKQRKKLSPAGRTPTPDVQASHREIDALPLSFELCVQVQQIRGLCRTLGVLAWAKNLDGLSFEDIGHTALLMEQALDGVHEGLEKLQGLEARPRSQAAA